jgi:AraC family cel operon transcriptional repressor
LIGSEANLLDPFRKVLSATDHFVCYTDAMRSVPRYLWRQFAAPNEAFHLARSHKTHSRPVQEHCHDFAEICWVESGEGSHLLNGDRYPLRAGDIFFILPDDCHSLGVEASQTMGIVNLAFPPTVVDEMRYRYFVHEERWFWGSRSRAGSERLSPEQVARTGQAVDILALANRERFPLDWFLLTLFHELGARHAEALPSTIPEWLRDACQKIRQPEHFRDGMPAFFRLAGKSPEHVARTMRAHTGMTPTDFLNRARLDHAALQLRTGQSPVTQVAYDSGFENLSHFFHLFRRRFGMSPGVYRQRRRQDIA